MNEQAMSVLAMAVELGTPLALVAVSLLWRDLRHRTVVVLGSLSPLLLGYMVTATNYYVLGREEARWAFHAMWLMSFVPFAACAALGGALAFMPKPKQAFARYLVGFVGPSLLVIASTFGV